MQVFEGALYTSGSSKRVVLKRVKTQVEVRHWNVADASRKTKVQVSQVPSTQQECPDFMLQTALHPACSAMFAVGCKADLLMAAQHRLPNRKQNLCRSHQSKPSCCLQGATQMGQMEHLLNVYASRAAPGKVADFIGYIDVASAQATRQLSEGTWLVGSVQQAHRWGV